MFPFSRTCQFGTLDEYAVKDPEDKFVIHYKGKFAFSKSLTRRECLIDLWLEKF